MTRNRSIRSQLVMSAVLGLILTLGTAPVHTSAQPRPIGDTNVFAVVPDPGQPAGIAVDGTSVLVTTMGLVSQPLIDPRLFVFDRAGRELRASVTIPRMMEATAMTLMDVAVDAAGRAYVVDMNGRVLRVDPRTGDQELYAEFPAAVAGAATMPFGLAFDRSGTAYVTDQNLSAIWRIPAGGGAPEIWFQDPRLASYILGPSGIRIDRSGRHLYFTVAAAAASGGQGVVFRLPVDDPSPTRLEEVFRYPPRSNPFGLALGASGKLYVALYGAHQISVLRPDGTEELRFPSAEENGARQIPYDRPVAAAFDGHGSLLVTNSASQFSSPDRMVVFDVFVNDAGAPLVRPIMPDHPRGGATSTHRGTAGDEPPNGGFLETSDSAPAQRPPTPQARSSADFRPELATGPPAHIPATDQVVGAPDVTVARRVAVAAKRHAGPTRLPAIAAGLALAAMAGIVAATRIGNHKHS
jgi:streptogramin lyase